jgi:putative copper export protein/mono/diheme cytochrome c family protein
LVLNAAGVLWHFGAVFALGGTLFLRRSGPVPSSLLAWRGQLRWALAAVCFVAWCAGVVVLLTQSTRIAGHRLALGSSEWSLLLTHTRFGQVWITQQILASCLMATTTFLACRRLDAGLASICLAALFLAAGIYAGHGGATPPIAFNFPLHVMHTLAAAGWLGGLPLWTWLVWRADLSDPSRQYIGKAIQRFSTYATWMIATLLLSGTLIAWQQFERWPAFFGTHAGSLLMIKLGLLGVALSMAWQLRRAYLDKLAAPHDINVRRAALRLIACEMSAAFGVFMVALALARMEPGAHQTMTWWLPFRMAPSAAWVEPTARWQTVAGVGLVLCGLLAFGWHRRWFALVSVFAGVGVISYSLAIPAFPDTYRRSTVAYTALSISRGAALFSAHCAGCHGSGARGGDERMSTTGAVAADLSQHTALHTAGDMFWWLTHGTPSGNMPGFASTLKTTQRWDLINFLRAFADGHSGRILGPRIMPNQPWLGAPNFQFETASVNAELKDFREHQPVLLILASLPDSTMRLRDLNAQAPRLRAAGLMPLVVVRNGTCIEADLGSANLACVTVGGEAIVEAYQQLARTLNDPGSRDALAPTVAHAEFLIDRFGYLRARWIPTADGEGWQAQTTLLALVNALATEPRILDSPDEHVH